MTTASKSAPLSVWRPIATDTFLVGAPHYPEHVDESYWQRDADRMAAAGFNTVRLAEFAWHILEPHEGTFDFDLFDRAIDVQIGRLRRKIETDPAQPQLIKSVRGAGYLFASAVRRL